MVSDARIQQAREHHRALADTASESERHRLARNALIRQLRQEDPERWTYTALARAIDCSQELIAAIVKGRT